MRGKALLEQWIDLVWRKGDLAAIGKMFSPTTRAEGMMDFAVTAADFEALVPAFLAHVEVDQVSVHNTVEQADWVSAFIAIRARSRASGAPVVFSGQLMARVADDRFAEVYNSFDFLSFFEQLGLLPHDTFALCLAGEPIGA